jgi:hypothetical protein
MTLLGGRVRLLPDERRGDESARSLVHSLGVRNARGARSWAGIAQAVAVDFEARPLVGRPSSRRAPLTPGALGCPRRGRMPFAECLSPIGKTKHELLVGVARLARLQALDDLDVEAGLHRRRRARPVTILRRGKFGPRQHRPTRRRLATTTAACGRFAAASARAAFTVAADEARVCGPASRTHPLPPGNAEQ